MEGEKRIRIVPDRRVEEGIRVVDLETGADVFRPDVAEEAVGKFAAGIGIAGGDFDDLPGRVIMPGPEEIPDNVIQFPRHNDTDPRAD